MKIIKKNLSFGSALKALKHGHKITRSVWNGYWFMPNKMQKFNKEAPSLDTSYIDKLGHPLSTSITMNPMIVAKLRDNLGFAPAQPYQVDILADDWEIVK